jgi:hypothetical protein
MKSMLKVTKKSISRVRDWAIRPLFEFQRDVLQSQHDFLLRAQSEMSARWAKNPLNRFGAKYFSQTDEDGITLEIIRRIGIQCGTFAELGVGNGFENNTLILLASGWRGFWIGTQDVAFNHTLNPTRFVFFKEWVSLANVKGLVQQGMDHFSTNGLDVLSLDLDGNDFYFAQELLKSGVFPKLFICEYNAKFPPPLRWMIKYDEGHSWDGTDYFGASLQSFADLLGAFSYTLVCCNAATGTNAFFIRNKYLSQFGDIPKAVEDLFVGCRYQTYKRWAHPPSPRTVEQMLVAPVSSIV